MANCNEANCTCPNKTCPNHGKCCACVNNHRKSGSIVLCMRDLAGQK